MKLGTKLAVGMFLLGSSLSGFAQEHDHSHKQKVTEVTFIENQNQWHENALFKAGINGGEVWLENQTFTYLFNHHEDVAEMHRLLHLPGQDANLKEADHHIRKHAFKVHFKGSSSPNAVIGHDKQTSYHNYFHGNDSEKWASKVPLFHEVEYNSLYPEINLRAYSKSGDFKYDYIVEPSGDPSSIQLQYEGVDNLKIKNGKLVIETSVGEIIEDEPFAFQKYGGYIVKVKCSYRLLNDNTVVFDFPEGYDSEMELIIDPTVIASTYSGSTTSIYGHTATYDQAGNIYSAGAEVATGGYPTTVGAFQTSAMGARETAITKYNPDGSSQIYATYIGGTGDDYPHSLFVNASDEVYILGSTNSNNYPTSASAAYGAFNGGTNDVVVTALSADGSALVGSTYVGGTGNDGQNAITSNYGDTFRGEIILDANSNAYIATMTTSGDFPVSAGAMQVTPSGLQDGVVFKLNPDLSSLDWATYMGGTGDDAAYGLVLDDNDDLFVTGSATAGFPSTPTTLNPTYLGGDQDAFIVHLSNNGTTMINGTFLGSAEKDQGFFIELDGDGDVYVMGQNANGSLTATANTYAGPGTGSFIQSISPDLTTSGFVSTFSKNAPTAFLVDDCDNIYSAGHGGVSILSPGGTGFDVSASAIDADGAGFYLLVLERDAASMLYATFYGNDGAHVDGGTSRFDPQGVVYENVCTDAGSPTTANAFSTASQSGTWDNYVFKIDFEATGVVANADAAPNILACDPPYDVQFNNGGNTAPDHFWDFDDGFQSTDPNPNHTFTGTGIFNVMYIVTDSTTCNISDTAYVVVEIYESEVFSAEFQITPPPPCSDTLLVDLMFTGSGADSVVWDMGDGNTFLDTMVTHTYTIPGTYTITMTAYDNLCNNVGVVTETVTLQDVATGGILMMPNVFTPNNDAKNEKFQPFYLGQPGVDPLDDLQTYDITIYNRWGKIVFESDATTKAWDGKIDGKVADEAVYYYIVRYQSPCDTEEIIEEHGHLSIMR
jgi:gliding motility-associated-like protein